MRIRLLKSIGLAAGIMAVIVFFKPAPMVVAGQAPTASAPPQAAKAAPAPKTPWGEPDLLVERWTRLDANTLQYQVTIEDPTVWKRPWTVRQEFTRQSDEANRIYYEPRCHEGEQSMQAMMLSQRLAELAYAEGRGPHPATKDNATDFVGVEENPLQ